MTGKDSRLKDLAYAVVICKVWRSAMAVLKWLISPNSNPKNVLSSPIIVAIYIKQAVSIYLSPPMYTSYYSKINLLTACHIELLLENLLAA
jgi:hypothetical protein